MSNDAYKLRRKEWIMLSNLEDTLVRLGFADNQFLWHLIEMDLYVDRYGSWNE